MNKIIFWWEELKATFWFIPVLIITITIFLALTFLYLDTNIEVSQEGIGRYIFVGSADSARSILTTMAGAMIGVAGTVFSITLVVLTLASSQFGPRLIKNFMYDRINQIVLGSYIATFIYCLLVLNTIKSTEYYEFVPVISVMMAMLAALSNIVFLIIFIHHIAVSIQAEKVISDISASMIKNIKVLFPEKMGDQLDDVKEHDAEEAKSSYKHKIDVEVNKNGYLQYIDNSTLMNLVVDSDSLVELHYRPGNYLVDGLQICTLYTSVEDHENLVKSIQGVFELGESRTQQQDAEHSIDQMVEIAVRALSPGVNDPYTAIACVDNLTAVLSYLAKVSFPSKYRYDKDEKLRVVVVKVDFEGVMDAAFNQIRQFSAGSPSVVIRLMESLITIHRVAGKNSYKEVVCDHAQMILNMAKTHFTEPNDLKDLEKRSQQILNNKDQ